jgi:hypothetical protein
VTKFHANKGIVMQIGLVHGNCLMNRGVSGEGSGKKMEGNGMEDSKERGGDKGEQTHAKPPPAASCDPGSGDKIPPPPRKGESYRLWPRPAGGGAGDSSRFN